MTHRSLVLSTAAAVWTQQRMALARPTQRQGYAAEQLPPAPAQCR